MPVVGSREVMPVIEKMEDSVESSVEVSSLGVVFRVVRLGLELLEGFIFCNRIFLDKLSVGRDPCFSFFFFPSFCRSCCNIVS